MKETDDASKERLEALRQEIAEVQEKLNVQKAGWLNQKNAIDHVQELKGQLDEAKSEEERATRNGDLGRASELRYSVIPGLQQQIQDSEAALEAQKEQDGEGLNEQVTSDEIAEVVSAWTGVPVSKMMQGELDKLKGLEGELHKRVIGQDEAVSAVAAAVRVFPTPTSPSVASSSWAPPAWARPSSPRRWPSACSTTSVHLCVSTCPSTWRSSASSV